VGPDHVGDLLPSDPMDATVESRRRDVVTALREANAASEDLKRMFDDLDVVTREAVEKVEFGSTALELAESMGLADRRENLNAAADRMRKSRHEFQRAMFLLALAEGSSRAEIARVWRVSRQLVSRMAGEHVEDHE
jgi:DNA-directed RNA polymerase specialized sigma24 family protein